VRAKVVKNKVAPPFKEAIFEIIFGKGIMRENAALEAAVAGGIIDRSGTWYSYKNEKIGQGKDAAVNYFVENPEIFKEVEKRTKDKHFGRGEFSPEAKEKEEKEAAAKEAAEEKAKKAAELAAAKAKIIKAKN
ncbi:MAG TPA: DNA recombination/repair protein RecA, partial [Firmicutes bacterium]|nr:DNA recombination/repair protein RecA [Bacillota bacterium]